MPFAVLVPSAIRRSVRAIAIASRLAGREVRVRGAEEGVSILAAAGTARYGGVGVGVLGGLGSMGPSTEELGAVRRVLFLFLFVFELCEARAVVEEFGAEV